MSSREHLVISGNILVVTIWGMVLLASRGCRPGMLLNFPRCAGEPLTMRTWPAPNDDSAKVEKSYLVVLEGDLLRIN